jgi:hypothetical protein
VPFRFNTAQRRYSDVIVSGGVGRDIVAKARKWGFTTLRCGLQLHGCLYRLARIGRTYTHREKTAYDIADIVHTLYDEANATLEEYGEDPRFYIPRNHSNARLAFDFKDVGGQVFVETAGGTGVGRAGRTNDAYLTEFADWEKPGSAWSGILGSIPPSTPGNRITVDFNANDTWMGSEAYTVWQGAQDSTSPNWNGFTPFFAGVLDVPELYTTEALDAQKRALGPRYQLSYPETADDLYKQRDRCCFNFEHLRDCTRPGYAVGCSRFVHGVDTAQGMPDGDYQAMSTYGWTGSAWDEVCPPIHERVPEDIFAGHVDERARQYPGTVVVEANVGSAVLVRLRELGTPGLYKHKHRDKSGTQRRKLGFQTTYASKRIMITDLQRHLREGTLHITTPATIDEAREFEWKEDSRLAGAPDRTGAHDDLLTTVGLAMAGVDYGFIGAPPVQYR